MPDYLRKAFLPFFAAGMLFLFVSLTPAQIPQALIADKRTPEKPVADTAAVKAEKSILLAQKHEADGNFEKAIDLYKKILIDFPRNHLIYNNLGADYALLKIYDKAAVSLEKAVKLKPDFALANFNLSVVYQKSARSEKALKFAQVAAKFDPGNTKFLVNLCELNLALDNFKKASACFEKLLDIDTSNIRARNSYGLLLIKSGKNKRATAFLEETVRAFPDNFVAHNLLGLALVNRKLYADALVPLRRSVELKPNYAPSRFNLGVAFYFRKKRADALEQYKLLQTLHPQLAEKLFEIIFKGKVIRAPGNN